MNCVMSRWVDDEAVSGYVAAMPCRKVQVCLPRVSTSGGQSGGRGRLRGVGGGGGRDGRGVGGGGEGRH